MYIRASSRSGCIKGVVVLSEYVELGGEVELGKIDRDGRDGEGRKGTK